MLKILIVDDEQEKRRQIIASALQVDGVDYENIEEVTDARAAKNKLKAKQYDLVILDINIPVRSGEAPKKDAGVDVLNSIKMNEKIKPPRYVVGLSAYEDVFEGADQDFDDFIFSLVKFEYDSDSWSLSLQNTLRRLVVWDAPPYLNDGVTYHVDAGVVCALEEELEAVLNLPFGWEEVEVPYDHARYHRGVMEYDGGQLDIVAVAAPQMGMSASAIVATRLISNFRPKLVMMAGICAGVRGKANLGDVLVADPCFDWGSGKWVSDSEAGTLKFRPAHYQWRLDHKLNRLVASLAGRSGIGEVLVSGFLGGKPSGVPGVKMDAMASGASVLQASALMGDVVEQHKNLIGVEMESYAVFSAVEYAGEPRPLCISMKSVCDFGDEGKADGYHAYACHTSAQFVYEFLKEWAQ
jgi:nucleoside phosphorylase/CheY-like chemotaxis protein